MGRINNNKTTKSVFQQLLWGRNNHVECSMSQEKVNIRDANQMTITLCLFFYVMYKEQDFKLPNFDKRSNVHLVSFTSIYFLQFQQTSFQ